MKYKSLYRKYRPNTFSEIVSQENIIKILRNSIANNTFNHAYLFSGSKGTGKTSTAKIFAKAINCQSNIKGEVCDTCEACININNENYVDILEIDGASNNGVDEIRSIRENINLLPMNAKYKVYIIDEVHMLTTSAFNALLKTLEEPPQHIIFILATTEPYKVLPTIISRCQWFEFKKINVEATINHFIKILNNEKIEFEIEAINELAILSDGSLRDGLNYLEKVFNYNNIITLINVEKIFSVLSIKNKIKFLTSIFNCNMQAVIEQLIIFDEYTIQYKKFIIEFIYVIEDIIIYHLTKTKLLLKMLNISQVNIFSEVVKSDLYAILNAFNEVLIQDNVDDLKPILILKILNLINIFESKYTLNYEENSNKPEVITSKVSEVAIIEPLKTSLSEVKKMPEIVEPKIELEVHQVPIDKNNKISHAPIMENVKNSEIIYSAINLILQADKDIRKEVNHKWKKISDFVSDNKFRNISKIYINTLVAAAAKNGIIIITENIIQADLINQKFLNKEHRKFLTFLLGKEYMFFALDKIQWQKTRKKYQELLTKNMLPQAENITISQVINETIDDSDKDPTLHFVQRIFSKVEEI
ncbi:DNA polymerase III subunit gamma/tau [Spiroplasma sp. AdecLV25b]|uniref:DNA polymerase III subunit gamma/tau n=1 Tax=Spiroplasma sp. AdecLV25b TaxID=3027162 RepID=UPI0027E0A93B|nr:DNA polymerase III subunit gamma/tau [Spiroplasma sp. AdecLV25b]